MANWTINSLEINCYDNKKLEKVKKILLNEDWEFSFEVLVPIWYSNNLCENDFRRNEWGTKRDASVFNFFIKDNAIFIDFDTARSPPIYYYDALYEELWNIWCDMIAYYFEPWMMFSWEYYDWQDYPDDREEFELIYLNSIWVDAYRWALPTAVKELCWEIITFEDAIEKILEEIEANKENEEKIKELKEDLNSIKNFII